MIRAENISYAYGKGLVLSPLSFTLRDGEFTAVIGENGSGKSTLLRLLARVTVGREGRLYLDGEDYTLLSRRTFAKRLSYFPQARPTPEMTVRELLLYGRYPYPTERREESLPRMLSALDATDTSCFLDRALPSLSYGERQRVYLSMLLMQDTQTLLLDEPTTYMDAAATFSAAALLSRLTREGKCVTAVIHDLSLALSYADRVLVLKEGGILFDGSPDAAVETGAISRAFGVTCTPVKGGDRISYVIRQG